MDGQVDQTVAVPPFIVVPCDDFVEVIIEEDARFGVNGGGRLASDKVRRHNFILRVCEDSLHFTFRGFLEGGEDF